MSCKIKSSKWKSKHFTRLGIKDPEVTKTLMCRHFISGADLLSDDRGSAAGSLFLLDICSKKARPTIGMKRVFIRRREYSLDTIETRILRIHPWCSLRCWPQETWMTLIFLQITEFKQGDKDSQYQTLYMHYKCQSNLSVITCISIT